MRNYWYSGVLALLLLILAACRLLGHGGANGRAGAHAGSRGYPGSRDHRPIGGFGGLRCGTRRRTGSDICGRH